MTDTVSIPEGGWRDSDQVVVSSKNLLSVWARRTSPSGEHIWWNKGQGTAESNMNVWINSGVVVYVLAPREAQERSSLAEENERLTAELAWANAELEATQSAYRDLRDSRRQ